jgi:hypothetical protein
VLRSKATGLGLPSYDAPASASSVRRMASRPTRSLAVHSNSPRSILARLSHHSESQRRSNLLMEVIRRSYEVVAVSSRTSLGRMAAERSAKMSGRFD